MYGCKIRALTIVIVGYDRRTLSGPPNHPSLSRPPHACLVVTHAHAQRLASCDVLRCMHERIRKADIVHVFIYVCITCSARNAFGLGWCHAAATRKRTASTGRRETRECYRFLSSDRRVGREYDKTRYIPKREEMFKRLARRVRQAERGFYFHKHLPAESGNPEERVRHGKHTNRIHVIRRRDPEGVTDQEQTGFSSRVDRDHLPGAVR